VDAAVAHFVGWEWGGVGVEIGGVPRMVGNTHQRLSRRIAIFVQASWLHHRHRSTKTQNSPTP
jgi:hypothetical protein